MATITTPVFKLGKYRRLFVAATTGATDADFTLIQSENDVEASMKSDNDSVATKQWGKITLPEGDVSWQLKITIDEVEGDDGYILLASMVGTSTPIQVRDTKNNKVIIEGLFTATDNGQKAGEKGAVQSTFTLDNSGPITWTRAAGGRAVTGTGS